jgi:predicted transglutaminase-like cysteine proteinase
MCFNVGKDKDGEIERLHEIIEAREETLRKADELVGEYQRKYGSSEFENFLYTKFNTATLKYQKRWVFAKDQCYPVDVRDFCKPWRTIPDVGSIEQVFKHKVQYVYDNFDGQGIPDYWQFPVETYALGKGDCEDSAALRVALARALGNKEVLMVLGTYNGGGHMFNLLWKDEKIYICENTSNVWNPQEIPGNDLAAGLPPYKINYVFNENQCWVVNGDINFGEWAGRRRVGT